MSPSQETFFVLNDDGSISRVEQSRTVNQVVASDRLNAELLKEFRRTLMITQKRWLCVTADRTYIMGELNGIDVLTSWQACTEGDKSVLRPVPGGASGAVSMRLTWVPPNRTAKILFVTGVEKGGANQYKPRFDSCYLFVMAGDGMCYKPPFPNIYNDGRVCMGEQSNAWSGTPVGAFDYAVRSLQSSPYNRDLQDESVSTSTSNRYLITPDGPKQILFEDDSWTDRLMAISSSITKFTEGGALA